VPAQATCLNPNADTRLRTFCVAETLEGNTVTLGDALLLDTLLKREGFAAGLGLPNQVERHSSQAFVSPVLDYNSNINGGNPDRALVLGALTFNGDEALVRRDGIVAGAAMGVNGRRIYGDGDYLDYGLSASYAYSPEHDMGIARASAYLCSRNHIAGQWYGEACGDVSRLVRDLDAETTRGVSFGATNLFTTGNGAFHSASFGIRRHYTEDYQQNQLQLSWNTVRSSGPYTSLRLSFGEALPNQLVTRSAVSATLGTTLFDRALTATMSYSYADGGRLLGFERNDTTSSININYAVTPNLALNVGYSEVDSSIDYFSEDEPVVSIQFVPLRF
jgi:hypothetical protein